MSSFFPRIFCALFLLASFSSNAQLPSLLAVFASAVTTHSKANERHLILVTDVYQEEQHATAGSFVVTTALRDKVSPIVLDKHTLQFVTTALVPSQWHIYKKSNLVLLIPKDYLKDHTISAPNKAGFDLSGWQEVTFQDAQMTGTDLYNRLPKAPLDSIVFDASERSIKSIKQLFSDTVHRWKVFAFGHGSPDAQQICGLNLSDFKSLLKTLNDSIKTDFLIYQTCFGGGKRQLNDVYINNQNKFDTFNYPIISGTLNNSVSFAPSPGPNVSYKDVFGQINRTIIDKKDMQQIIRAGDKFNNAIQFAKNLHGSNNLLLLRPAGKEVFTPIVDNNSVFAMSDIPTDPAAQALAQNASQFKCIVVDKPTIQTVDLRNFKNITITSAIPTSKHYIKELLLPGSFTDEKIALEKAVALFGSLLFPHKGKLFYIETLKVGAFTFNNVTIRQEPKASYENVQQTLSYQAEINGAMYSGTLTINVVGEQMWQVIPSTSKINGSSAAMYKSAYAALIAKHLNKVRGPLFSKKFNNFKVT